MKVTREQMAEHRQRILDCASRLFRAHGFEAVTVAAVMQAAGLTHGGFYGHFKSKDDLIAETLAHVLRPGSGAVDLADFAKRSLAPRHRDDLAGGCPTAGLGAETIRQGPAARAAMTEGLRGQIQRFSAAAPGASAAARRRAAIGSWSAMVGAVVLARLSDDPALSDEMLAETRAWLEGKGVGKRAAR
jgi:TetR/AcrR family transcriptional repressor of nem operon